MPRPHGSNDSSPNYEGAEDPIFRPAFSSPLPKRTKMIKKKVWSLSTYSNVAAEVSPPHGLVTLTKTPYQAQVPCQASLSMEEWGKVTEFLPIVAAKARLMKEEADNAATASRARELTGGRTGGLGSSASTLATGPLSLSQLLPAPPASPLEQLLSKKEREQSDQMAPSSSPSGKGKEKIKTNMDRQTDRKMQTEERQANREIDKNKEDRIGIESRKLVNKNRGVS